MNDEQINHAIDQAVRELLDVEPRGDLRARVMSDLDRPASGFGWNIRVAAGLAVMAAVLIGIGVLTARHVLPAQTLSGRIEPPSVTLPNETTPPVTGARTSQRATEARVEPPRSPRPSSRRLALAANTDADPTALAPLEAIEPIRVAAVAPSDIAPQPIAIEPLAQIPHVQIAPLTPPDGRH